MKYLGRIIDNKDLITKEYLDREIHKVNDKIDSVLGELAAEIAREAQKRAENEALIYQEINSQVGAEEQARILHVGSVLRELNNTLTAERNNRTAEDTRLEALITTNTQDIGREVAEREAAETQLNERIHTEQVERIAETIEIRSTKQDNLVSGTNIKTINNQSLLGQGNINIQGGGSTISYDDNEKALVIT